MIRRRISDSSFAIYCWIFQVVTVMSLTSVVIWLSLRPRIPDFSITSVSIQALGTQNTTVNRNETTRDTSIVFNLQISNPNKGMGVYYNDVSIRVYSGELLVGTNSTQAFYQGPKNTAVQEVLIDADQQFWRELTNGNVELRVTVKTAVRYKIFIFQRITKHRQVGCEAIVRISTNGTMSTFMKLH